MTSRRVAVRAPRVVGAVVTLALAAAGCTDPQASPDAVTASPQPTPTTTAPTDVAPSGSSSPAEGTGSPAADGTSSASGPPRVVGTAARDLAVPWGLDFLPSGEAVVTERDSRRVLLLDGRGGVREAGVLEEAVPQGEAGLLGVAVSPEFARDRALYFYLTTAVDNRIVRARLEGGRLGEPEVLLDGIPAGFIHDGGRLEFGPDGLLYAATGEAGDPELSRDRDSLGGKILRLTPDGRPAPGNPFGTAVWSWGHRNVQGLAFDDADRLWASELGANTWDELNLVRRGADHGWPLVEGVGHQYGLRDPQVVWPTADASPSGLAYLDGSLWMAALRGGRLWRIPLDGARAGRPRDFLVGQYGRLRTVAVAPDGNLWVTTSNRDGRGEPAAEDDRVLVVSPG